VQLVSLGDSISEMRLMMASWGLSGSDGSVLEECKAIGLRMAKENAQRGS